MPLEHLQSLVEDFISDTHNDLFVLKGKWGVGKTFFWKRLIEANRTRRSVGKRWYSYVSLFGVSSLDDLKNSIIASRVEANTSNWRRAVQSRTASLKELTKDLEKTKLGTYTGGLINEYLYQLLVDSLICLDDLERKGDNLNFKDIFGLTAVLKEQRGCKVILILNDESLAEEAIEQFRRHGEKLIDREVSFTVDEEEAFGTIFVPSFRSYDTIRECCLRLHIKNMRILQRIKRAIEDMNPHLQGSEEKLIDDVMRSLVLFVWSYYDKEGQAPPLEFIYEFSLAAKFIRGKYRKEQETPQIKSWEEILGSYNYFSTTPVDEQLIEFVKTGFIDKGSLRKVLDKKNQQLKAFKADANYNEVWDLYRNSFDDNEAEFLDQMEKRFRSNIQFLSLADLQNAASTLRSFARDNVADALIDQYFELRRSEKDIEGLKLLRRTMFSDDFKDDYLIKQLRAVWDREEVDTRSLGEILRENYLKRDWNFQDVRRLDALSVNDYYDFFKSEHSDALFHYVRTCLNFRELSDENGMHKSVADKATQALIKLASESRINRDRVLKLYGIDLNEDLLPD